jgi:hypothetical protein
LIKRLWRYLKDKLACYRLWTDLERLQQAAEIVLSRLAVHFHPTDGPAFRPLGNLCETASAERDARLTFTPLRGSYMHPYLTANATTAHQTRIAS